MSWVEVGDETSFDETGPLLHLDWEAIHDFWAAAPEVTGGDEVL